MLIVLVCAAVLVALLFPETPVGRLLRRLLIERLADRLAGLTLVRLLKGLLVLFPVVALVAAVHALEHGTVLIAAAPDALAWVAAVDVAAYFDVVAAVFLIAATVRLRVVAQALRLMAARARRWAVRCAGAVRGLVVSGRNRSRRPRPPIRRPRRNDDADRPAPGLAPYGLAFA